MNRRNYLARTAALFALHAVATGAQATNKARVGLVLPFTGLQSEVAQELRQGYELAFLHAAQIGVDVDAVWEDDQGLVERTVKCVERFGRDRTIVAMSGLVGTANAAQALPMAVRVGLPIVGIRSGASELRDGAPGVFHLRASYSDEIALMISHIKGAGLNRLSVIYPDDAFGRMAEQQVRSAADDAGLQLASTLACDRSGTGLTKVVEQALQLRHRVGALIMLTLAAPTLVGVVHARRSCQFMNPVYCMSFCATRGLTLAKEAETTGLGLASPFPLPSISELQIALRFRRMVNDMRQDDLGHSLTCFEGFFYGSVLVSALAQAPDGQRHSLVAALRRPRDMAGMRVDFDSRNVGYRHLQMLHKSALGGLRV